MELRKCGVPEEKWIDYHSGRLDPMAASELLRHREACPDCDEASEQWSGLLRRAARDDAEESRPKLRTWRKRHLQAHVVWRGLKEKTRRKGKRWRAAGVTAGLAFALLAGAIALLQTPDGDRVLLESQRYAKEHVPVGEAVMSRPDTVMYRLGAGSDAANVSLASGTTQTVWINVRTQELFLLLDGMLPSDKLDVQAWALVRGKLANLGVLEFNNNHAHLYSRGVRPELWEAIALTMEPKGGSRHPTSPDAAMFGYVSLP
ncbi:anti-sigma factor [Cohnella algarum]|uniref:anti-sigma factor n=1 Tax=Cohnella algarum TaxID=2044859 RepID=UPI00196813C4|nr:anti-sigma factor [Cohnella algarum]MBN2984392.1 anti-sigma factor [Cohnella algarum]